MYNVKLQAAREFIVDEYYETARAILRTMKDSPTARKWLEKIDEIAPVPEDTPPRWEYLEVFVKANERLPEMFYDVMDGFEQTTLDHFYSRMLNDYGDQGWELVSEELQGGDVVRLLFKRRKLDG